MEKRPIDRERAVIADHQTAEIPQPGERPFNYPAPFVASKNAAILWRCTTRKTARISDSGRERQTAELAP
jgi:hypothetical protein